MMDALTYNKVDLWIDNFPDYNSRINKYDRGHAVILGAPEMIGATRLAASACSRIGAGLVTVVADIMPSAYRISLPADIMVQECSVNDLTNVDAILGGPGGISGTHLNVLTENKNRAKRVFDAGALCEDISHLTFDKNTVLTPHDGEFSRLFGSSDNSRIEQTINAAKKMNCIIVRKGAETIIAQPDGTCVVNAAPNPFLAKAGTGDVLAGFITGLLAQGMDAFHAACAAVWIHSEAGDRIGPGLTSCDLEFALPEILRELICELDFGQNTINYTSKID